MPIPGAREAGSVSEQPRGSPTVVPLGNGRYLLDDGARRRFAFGTVVDGAVWVWLEGAVHVVEARARRGRAARSDQDAAIAAPMPATVLRVDAAPGQAVRRGETLIVLEAMKMELPLKAGRDGTVTAVRCRPGELVQPGIPLVDIE